MRRILLLLLAAAAPAFAQQPGAGSDVPRAAPKAHPVRFKGIYPVYAIDGRWILVDRSAKGEERSVEPGRRFVVIGSKATDVFEASASSTSWGAACVNHEAAPTPTLILSGKGMGRVGTPIVAIVLPKDRRINPRAARFYRLENQVTEDVYAAFNKPLQDKVVSELRSGEFAIDPGDAMGAQYAQDPGPENILLKIDFGASVKLAGSSDAFFLVDGVQVSKTLRRCARLFLGNTLAGKCAEMPHDLMAETNVLDFVAYDPNGDGHPFVLAYSTKEPLWGHERWGFRITPKGPSVFLMDALDPKCRAGF